MRTFQPTEAVISAFWDATTLVDTDADLTRALAAIADQLTVERLTAAAMEGPWSIGSFSGDAWFVDTDAVGDSVGPFYIKRWATLVCGALNLAARLAPAP